MNRRVIVREWRSFTINRSGPNIPTHSPVVRVVARSTVDRWVRGWRLRCDGVSGVLHDSGWRKDGTRYVEMITWTRGVPNRVTLDVRPAQD